MRVPAPSWPGCTIVPPVDVPKMNGSVGAAGEVPTQVGPGSNWNSVPLMMPTAPSSAAAATFGALIEIEKLDGLAAVTTALTTLKIPFPLVVFVTVTCSPIAGFVPVMSV